ncbi:cytochrome P450 [Polyangium aurulentum]|uniref:cytochrome P450 n=1 Tax=Polyangium aurulentum TaxID=2567896 RepID=UPI0010AECFEC|nr:cytochrome P450 [Polyangium aurulentum]UQA62420.1 cytochrome P450 [Polyangium aurulentum]
MDERVNVLAPAFRANPYPHYAEMRRARPVCQVEPGGMWAVSRYEDVLFVLKNPELFSSQGFKFAWQPPWVEYNPLANSLLAMDPPAHGRLRALVSQAFGPRAVARLESRTQARANEMARGLPTEVELIGAFALPLPAFVIGDMLGLDHVLHEHFKRWGDDLLSVTPEPPSPEHAARVRNSIAELTGYMREVLVARRSEPRDDLVSDLLRAKADGQSLTDTEIVDFLVTLLLGGFETTTHLIGNAIVHLADSPGEMARLGERPELIPKFVEEMIRYDGPSQAVPRIATVDVTLGGVTIPRGSLVLALVASASRDESRYPEPDRFDIDRGTQGGLQFGHGIHFCLGAALARMETRAALGALCARFGRVERAAAEVEYNRTLTVRGPVRLPVRFELALRASG